MSNLAEIVLAIVLYSFSNGDLIPSSFLSSVIKGEKSNSGLNLRAGEFKLAGLWQYSAKWNSPCITIRRNWEKGLVSYLEKIDEKQKAYILRPNHLPVDWSDSPTEAFRWSESAGEEGKKADFVSVKGVFVTEENKFKVVEVLAEPSQKIPRYLKAPKPSTSEVND